MESEVIPSLPSSTKLSVKPSFSLSFLDCFPVRPSHFHFRLKPHPLFFHQYPGFRLSPIKFTSCRQVVALLYKTHSSGFEQFSSINFFFCSVHSPGQLSDSLPTQTGPFNSLSRSFRHMDTAMEYKNIDLWTPIH